MKTLTNLLLFLLISTLCVAQNDALKVEQYTLPNGLTVYLNSDKNANEVFGAVVVKAGSKNDPADATGIAHYLEHLLFKGTEELGTSNFELEKPHLDSITALYEMLGATSDEAERKSIQQKINEQSVLASKHGLPNEFDNLIKTIGGTGLNAFTNSDVTVYHNSFPGEQMDKWLQLYSHRFSKPIFRSFQSELEVVYEEKNRAMDNFQRNLFEELNKNLFKHHPYGTQSTLGTVEHLKSPSLEKMYEFFNTYYVANNMGLILCGNFDPEVVKPLIAKHFSSMRTGTLPPKPTYPKSVFTKNETVNIKNSPIKLELLGYKSIPEEHEDRAALDVLVSLMSNESETGSLDKLNQDRKLMMSGLFDLAYLEDGALVFIVVPKLIGQSFSKAEGLVYDEIDKLVKGEVSADALQVVKTELYRQHQKDLESYYSRTMSLITVFSSGSTWESYVDYSKRVDAVTLEDVKRVAKKYLDQPHFILRSRRGTPDKTVLDKPGFEPVIPDEKAQSEYAKGFKENKINPATPRFIDVDKDATIVQMNESNRLYAVSNPINDVFSLRVVFRVGKDSLPSLELASDLFSYCHFSDKELEEVKVAFAKLGLTYYSYASSNTFTVQFEGLEKNLDESIAMISKLLYKPEADKDKMKILKDGIKTNVKFEKDDPSTVGSALYQYAVYGENSPYLKRIGLKDFKKLSVNDIMADYKSALEYNALWHFVGKTSGSEVAAKISKAMPLANNKKEVAPSTRPLLPVNKTVVYITHDKKAVQSHINFVIPSGEVDYSKKNKTRFAAFNQYIGGGFSGIILQEIREFRSLAYSAGGYLSSSPVNDYNVYFRSFIGCQADKTNESIEVMLNVLDSMPEKPDRMEIILSGMQNKAASRYPGFRYMSYYVDYALQYGENAIFTEEEYAMYNELGFDDVREVYNERVLNRPKVISISGNKKKVDIAGLSEIGEVVYVKKKKLFR